MSKDAIGIVGGSGFVGRSLAEHLSDGFRVKVFDKKPLIEGLRNRVDFERCDVRDYDRVKDKIKEIDLVIYAAIVQIPLINEEKELGYEVNVKGIQNVCEAVRKSNSVRGLILTGSWHVFGESGFGGVIDEEFGFRPDKVEDRAKYYALTKVAQETIVRIYDEMSDKIYGTIRMGTVLGKEMPKKTVARIFLTEGLKGKAITPYKHSMYRPMFYVDIRDVCEAFRSFARIILNDEMEERNNSLAHFFNVAYPKPVTVLEVATITRDAIVKASKGKIRPEIKIVDMGLPNRYRATNEDPLILDISRVEKLLGLRRITSPQEVIERVVRQIICSH